MSYILEALKKADAERQLGSAPSIHAAPLHTAPASAPAARKQLLVGLGAGVLLAGAAGYVVLPQKAPAPAAPAPAAPAPAPVVVVKKAPPAPAPAPAVIKPEPAPEAPKPAPAPRAEAPKPVAMPAPPPEPKVAAAVPPPIVTTPAVVQDNAPPLSELPEAIRREVPQIAVGGYIYSANPADRLLLIDKVLRREGEEVAPGLTLERLLPKAAVLNYRGYRYRVPY